jgi:hypothetical protein
MFHHQHPRRRSITIDQQQEIKVGIDLQRSHFHQLISSQRILVNCASLEPSVWWFNHGFSSTRYSILVQEQLDMFRMLHNMHATVSVIRQNSILFFILIRLYCS